MPDTSRPAWPYVLSVLGGLTFGLGCAVLLYVTLANSESAAAGKVAIWATLIGATVLAVGWLGVFLQKQCGIGMLLGSLAVPLGFLYVYSNRDSWAGMNANAMIVLVAFAACALGHVFATGLVGVRVAAGVSLLGVAIAIIVLQQHVHVSKEVTMLIMTLVFGGLAAMGIAIAVQVPGLHRQPRPEFQL